MTETQQRFLRAIAERVPMEQVVELHLFPPIRQGGVETGVAVVAEDPRQPVVVTVMEAVESPEPIAAEELNELLDGTSPAEEIEAVDGEDVEDMTLEANDSAQPPLLLDDDDDTATEDAVIEADHGDGNGHAHAPRFIIHTARYRLTLKGVDRGKWEVDVVAEADAPLAALDAVVRGVQRRSGEGADPDRLTTDAFREALQAPLASLER